jgi:hypothetical protein
MRASNAISIFSRHPPFKRKFGQQTPRRWGWGTPLKKRTATRTKKFPLLMATLKLSPVLSTPLNPFRSLLYARIQAAKKIMVVRLFIRIAKGKCPLNAGIQAALLNGVGQNYQGAWILLEELLTFRTSRVPPFLPQVPEMLRGEMRE